MTQEDEYLISQIRAAIYHENYQVMEVYVDQLIERFEDIYEELKRRERAE